MKIIYKLSIFIFSLNLTFFFSGLLNSDRQVFALDFQRVKEIKEKDRVFIILNSDSAEAMEKLERRIENQGGQVVYRFPNQALVGKLFYTQISNLKNQENVARIFTKKVSIKNIQKYGPKVVLAAELWNESFAQEVQIPDPDPGPILEDALFPEDKKRDIPMGGKEVLLGRAPYGATSQDTSEYMIGKISVAVILPESTGAIDDSQEDWDKTREIKVLSEIQHALDWWAEREEKADLSFVYHYYLGRIDSRAKTSYEPINRPSYTLSNGQELWISEIMEKFGYSDGDHFDTTRSFLNEMISNDKSDWGFIIFVVDSKNDIDGRFTDGKFGYAYYGGPFLVMTYDNDAYGINNMDAVAAHEVGHIFYALDQYYAAQKDCKDSAGYLDVENQNSEYNAEGGSCKTNEPSIMRGGVAPFAQKAIDYWARGQIGWWDSDNDGILDILDTSPILSFSKRKEREDSISYQGEAKVQPRKNNNRYADSLHEGRATNITLNKISSVQYRVDDGKWRDVSAQDGQFDEAIENFSFTVSFSQGIHQIEIRALNNQGNASSVYQDIVGAPSIITGAGPSGGPHIRVFDISGKPESGFFAYAEELRSGVKVAAGDVDGDGKIEIVTSPAAGGGPHIRIFKKDGSLKYPGFFAYDPMFRGGVNIALGDLDGDGKDEIVTGAGEGGGPHVRIFDAQGNPKISSGFFAYAKEFRGGVKVACADIDSDGKDEIITGAGRGGGPHVRAFEADGAPSPIQFFAFHSDFRGGIDVVGGDIDGDGKDEIAVSQAGDGEAWIKVYRYNKEKTILGEFRAYAEGLEVGAHLALGDIDLDGKLEIVTSPGKGGGPHIRAFEISGQAISPGFFAYDSAFRGGVFVAVK